jgi:hypothetical protein
LNELYEQNKAKGLIVVGVSDEDDKSVEEFIKTFGATYPILISKNGGNRFRINGFPSAFILSPKLEVLTQGNPLRFTQNEYEKALELVVVWPPEVPSAGVLKPLRAAWEGKRFGEAGRLLDALAADQKLPEAERKSVALMQGHLTAREGTASAEIKRLAGGPDFLAAQTRIEEIAREYEGRPPAAEAGAQLAAFKGDKKVQAEIAALKKLSGIERQLEATSKESEQKKLVPALRSLASQAKGTYAAERANALVNALLAK